MTREANDAGKHSDSKHYDQDERRENPVESTGSRDGSAVGPDDSIDPADESTQIGSLQDSVGPEPDNEVEALCQQFLEDLPEAAEPQGLLEDYCTRYPHAAAELRSVLRFQEELDGFDRTPSRTVPSIPKQLGDFRILCLIGRAGMGEVYEADQLSVNRRVAVKIVRRDRDSNDRRARFRRERVALARLHQTDIVPLLAAGQERHEGEQLDYFAMPFLEGVALDHVVHAARAFSQSGDTPSLGELASDTSSVDPAIEPIGSQDATRMPANSRGPSPGNVPETLHTSPRYVSSAVDCVARVARALHHANEHGIVHRDVKPANVIISADGDCWLIDFGLSFVTDAPARSAPDREKAPAIKTAPDGESADVISTPDAVSDGDIAQANDPDAELTQRVGTLAYMSPEQFGVFGGRVDRRTDVFGAGALLYTLLTLRPPLTAEHIRTLEAKELCDFPVSPREHVPDLPPDLEAICAKALAAEPGQRYESNEALAADLSRYQRGEPVQARPLPRIEVLARWVRRNPMLTSLIASVMALVMLAAGFAGFMAWTNRQETIVARRHNKALQERKRHSDELFYAGVAGKTGVDSIRAHAQHVRQQLDALRPQNGLEDVRGWEWFFLNRQAHMDELVLSGHTAAIKAVTYSPSGKLIATCSSDGTARLWEAATGKPLQVLRGHKHAVTCVAFSADESLLATGSIDATVRLWQVPGGEFVGEVNRHISRVNSVAFGGSRLVASASADATIQIYDVEQRTTAVLGGHGGEVEHVQFSPDGRTLATSGWSETDRTVLLWDVETQQVRHRFDGHTKYLEFLADGTQLMFSRRDDLRIVNVATGETTKTIVPPPIKDVGLLADVASTLEDGTTRTKMVKPVTGYAYATVDREGRRIYAIRHQLAQIHDMKTGELLPLPNAPPNEAAWSPDGEQLAVIGGDHTARVYSATPPATMLRGHRARVMTLEFNNDGTQLATGGDDLSIRLWNTATTGLLQTLGLHEIDVTADDAADFIAKAGHASRVNDIEWHPRDPALLATAGQDNTLRVWNTATGDECFRRSLTAPIMSIAWTPAGDRLAVGGWDDVVRLIDFPSGTTRRLGQHDEDVYGVVFLDGGQQLASLGIFDGVRIWDVATGEELQHLDTPQLNMPNTLAVSPDGTRLAAAGDGPAILVWDTNRWEIAFSLYGHHGRVDDLRFSPDSRRLVSASGQFFDNSARLWDMRTGLEVLSVPGARTASLSPDGRRLAVGWRPNDVRIYETKPLDDDPRRLARFKPTPAAQKLEGDDGKLRILGYFRADRLHTPPPAPALSPANPDHDFLVVALSLPHRFHIPTERMYAQLQATNTNSTPWSEHRENIALYIASNFQLEPSPTSRPMDAQHVTLWPPNPGAPGFRKNWPLESTRHIPKHERRALAVAFEVDRNLNTDGLSIRMGDQLVPLPSVELQDNLGLGASAAALLEARLLRVYEAVERGDRSTLSDIGPILADKDVSATTVYNAACTYGIAITKLQDEADLTASSRQELVDEYTTAAIALLRRALEMRFDEPDLLETDPDLTPLREHTDFKALLQ